MKSNFKPFLFPVLLALVMLIWAGCNSQYPSSYLSSNGPNAAMVVNFEGGSPLNVNPILLEANRPGNKVITAGGVLVAGGTGVTVSSALVPEGQAGTTQAFRVWGSFTDPGNATYPSIQLQIPLEKSAAVSAFYDASFFTGVKFFIKVMGSDTAGKKVFSIPIAQTQPPSAGGNCNQSAASNACYNDFNIVYTTTNGIWTAKALPFSTFTRGNYGSAVVPPTLSGTNLQQIIMLDWYEGNNNVNNTVNVDFAVDEVEFY